jgi:putative addiction module component (TIGR02574 family)
LPRELADIQRDAMEPSNKERANVVEHLLATLDADEKTASEELWMEEAEHRHADYRAGKIASKTAEQIFTGAQNKLN